LAAKILATECVLGISWKLGCVFKWVVLDCKKKFTVSAAWLQKFWQLNVCFASPDSLCFVCCMRVCVPAKLGSVQLECPGGMCVDVTDIGCACWIICLLLLSVLDKVVWSCATSLGYCISR
jgi:hypothetical protein